MTGVVAGVLILAGFFVQAPPPRPADTAAAIAERLAESRSLVLLGDTMIAVGAAFFLWFLGVLWGHLATRGERRLSTAGVLGGVVGMTVVLAGAGVQAGLVLNSASASAELVRFAFDAYNGLITIAAPGFAVAVAATAASGHRGGSLPAWTYPTGLATGALQLLTLPGLWAESGVFAAGGAMAIGAFGLLSLWFIAVSVHLATNAYRQYV